MNLDDIKVIGGPLAIATSKEVDAAEERLGIRFPSGYREYVTRFGEGVLGGCYIRIYPPWRILNGSNNVKEWRERIGEYWLWDEDPETLDQEKALQCVIIGDTLDGDELVVHPNNPERVNVLPRHREEVLVAGDGLLPAIEWLCSSGTLTEAFAEREFEPFDSRKLDSRNSSPSGVQTVIATEERQHPMETDCDFKDPEQVFREFMTAMNRWELDAFRSMPRVDDFTAMEQWWPRIADDRHRILDTYCVPKKRASATRPSVGSPPTYDPATTRIVETVQPSPSRTEIKTEDSSRAAGTFTYILVLKKGRWLLDAKQYVDWQGKTKKAAL
jgi:hypothetical protein